MSYETQADLRTDLDFIERCMSCLCEEARSFRNDGREEIARLANLVLAGDTFALTTWRSVLAVTPGFGSKPTSASITDGEILAAVQAQWPMVAEVIEAVNPAPIPFDPNNPYPMMSDE